MSVVQFKRVFSAAHRLHTDESKCKNIHGHNYRVTIKVDCNKWGKSNMLVPFDLVKEVVDDFDHKLILDERDPLLHELGTHTKVRPVPGVPSTEFLADYIAELLLTEILKRPSREQPSHVRIQVVLQETDNIIATGTRVRGRPQEV